MTVQTFELQPPTVRAARFDGTNAAEIAALVGREGPLIPQQDAAGVFLTLTRAFLHGEADVRVDAGQWVTMDDRGIMNTTTGGEDRPDGWRPTPVG